MVQGWLTKKEHLRGYESTRGKVIRGSKRMIIILAICYPPFLGVTKEMMSRGPQVANMECREMD
jgi:hypothetical protein